MARKAKLSRDQILSEALALIDEAGLDTFSMRRLGQRLGVEAMSLYNHVANKEAVFDGVYELVLSELVYPEVSEDWLENLRRLAVAFHEILRKHPKMLSLFATRPAVTRGSLVHVDAAMGLLEAPFPDPTERLYVYQTIVVFVVGHALSRYGDTRSEATEDVDLQGLLHVQSVNEALGSASAEEEFAVGLSIVLAGVAQQANTAK